MYTADEWPIACKANFGPVAEDGTPIIEAGPKVWYDQMLQMAELGFTCIDPMDDWLPMADLTEGQLRTYTELLADTGLRTASPVAALKPVPTSAFFKRSITIDPSNPALWAI